MNDSRSSLQFSLKDVEDVQAKLLHLEKQCQELDEKFASQKLSVESLADNHDYLEHMSRRNNVQIIGIPENTTESGEESEALFKSAVKKTFNMDKELHVERTHRIGSKRQFVTPGMAQRSELGLGPLLPK